jgi:hypothetical protein
VISGNETDGIALFQIAGAGTSDNRVVGNLIGLTSDGSSPLPNGGFGILNAEGAAQTHIEGNSIAFNESYGILVATCEGSTITQNAVYSNTLTGIRNEGNCPPPPQITGAAFGSTEIVTGTTEPNAWVEFFSDAEDEGQAFEGAVQADGAGNFVFGKAGGFVGPNLTATSTDAFGNTSEFSNPQHLWWTLLLYLNGDNDLEEFMIDTLTNTVAAGPSPRANVLMLVDGYTTTIPYSPTVVYDVTWGQAEPIDVTWNITGERNLGDGQALVDFVNWGQSYYPARYTLLAIVDHGGGWAGSTESVPGVLPVRDHGWFSGISGLSWDFTSDYDYLDSQEIRQALAAITDDGTQPIDVVFYDACLMGMAEVAYQIKDYASYFVSSQNIAWAPLGPQGRYVQTVQGIDPAGTTPRQMAELLVQAYASGLPPEGHPFTMSAVDLAAMPDIADAVDQLATAIRQTPSPLLTETLQVVYGNTQKLDYDSDLRLEPESDGFVDLYDLALRASEQFSDPDVLAAAENLRNELALAVVAEEHVSGSPWFSPTLTWDLDSVHGLSIFLPLGQDLDLDIPITQTSPITPGLTTTRNLRLLEMYTCEQLEFVCDTSWRALIDTYYTGTTVPTDTAEFPEQRLLPPDITPPQTVIALTGVPTIGQNIYLTWVATDAQASVREASLWHRPPRDGWTSVGAAQPGASGVFTFTLSQICENGFAVRAVDRAGNLEPLNSGSNTVVVTVSPCHTLFMPTIRHRFLEFD